MRTILFIIFYSFLLTSTLFSSNEKSLLAALKKYDPILEEKETLKGTLHFPEVQKVLPNFYQDLFKRVHIQLIASRSEFDINVVGKNEFLKDMVKQQFLSVEEQLKETFFEAIQKDPLYRLNQLKKTPALYENTISQSRNKTEFTFNNKITEVKKQLGPKRISFYLNHSGKLTRLFIKDWDVETEIEFTTQEKNKRFYFTELFLTQKRSLKTKHRKISIFYSENTVGRFPNKIQISDVDASGKLIKNTNSLNPVSLYFKPKDHK